MTRKAEEELKTPFSYFGYEPESEEEKRFLNDYNPEKWKKASHTADVAVFALSEAGLELLLVKRGGFPYKGHYCLPGGFINMDESLYETAARELEEETGLSGIPIFQVGSFGRPGRDPRDRNITTLYTTILNKEDLHAKAGDDAADTDWVLLTDVDEQVIESGDTAESYFTLKLEGKNVFTPEIRTEIHSGRYRTEKKEITDTSSLAFDHALEIAEAYRFIKKEILTSYAGINVLGETFRISALKKLLKAVLLEPGDDSMLSLMPVRKNSDGSYTYI